MNEAIKMPPMVQFAKLAGLVADLRAARKAIEEHTSVCVAAPPDVNRFDSEEDYMEHLIKIAKYNETVICLNQQRIDMYEAVNVAERAITNYIPKHTWFKVLIDEKPVWVGISTSNWGGGDMSVFIVTEYPTEPLKHHIYN